MTVHGCYPRAYAAQILLWVSYLKVLLDLEEKYGSTLPNVEFVLMTNDRPTRLTNCTRGYNPKGVAASPGDGSSSDSAFVTNSRNPCRWVWGGARYTQRAHVVPLYGGTRNAASCRAVRLQLLSLRRQGHAWGMARRASPWRLTLLPGECKGACCTGTATHGPLVHCFPVRVPRPCRPQGKARHQLPRL